MARCDTCRFWDGRGYMGRCRFLPPVRVSRPFDAWEWPETTKDDWCGQYAPKEQADS